MFTEDPVRDFTYHDELQSRRLERLPVCEYCGEPIHDEHFYEINDEFICEECLKNNFRKNTEDYCCDF